MQSQASFDYKTCLTSEKNGNVFSLYVGNYESAIDQTGVFITRKDFKTVIEPIYNTLAYHKDDAFALMDKKILRRAEKKIRRQGKKGEYDTVFNHIQFIGDNLATIQNSKPGGRIRPIINGTEHHRFNKDAIQSMVDFAHNISKDVSVNGTNADKLGLQEWMKTAKVNYDRTPLAEMFKSNQNLMDTVRTAHEIRRNAIQP